MMMGTGGAQVLYHGLRALERFDKENRYIQYHKQLGEWGNRGPLHGSVASAYGDILSKNLWIPFWTRKHDIEALFHFLPPISFSTKTVKQLCYILDVPENWENKSLQDWIYNNLFIRHSCNRTDKVLALSRFTADRIIRHMNVKAHNIDILYPCLDTDFFSYTPEQRLISQPYIFGIISNLSHRKNPGGYLKIYDQLPSSIKSQYKLYLAGAAKSIDDFVPIVGRDLVDRLRPYIEIKGRVSLEELVRLYSNATVTIFPSFYEGFGLPAIESQACGTPVVVSDIPPLLEISGDLASFCNPDDIHTYASKIEEVINNISAYPKDELAKRAKPFNYESFAKTVHHSIEELIYV